MNCNDTWRFNETRDANRAPWKRRSSDGSLEMRLGTPVPLGVLRGKHECVVGVETQRTGHMRGSRDLSETNGVPWITGTFWNALQYVPCLLG